MHPILQGLSHFIAPNICRVCGSTLNGSEEYICLGCDLEMPRLAIHNDNFNTIHQRLGHNCHVDRAAGWFSYKKDSPYSRLLIDAKYSNLPKLAKVLGRKCAQELMQEGFFSEIDLMVPMPMHWTKQLRRGYNQAIEICKGISEATGIPWTDALRAARPHGVQSRHTRDERFKKISGTIVAKRNSGISCKRVLFIDDIITTGASASEAIRVIQSENPKSIDALFLGVTSLS